MSRAGTLCLLAAASIAGCDPSHSADPTDGLLELRHDDDGPVSYLRFAADDLECSAFVYHGDATGVLVADAEGMTTRCSAESGEELSCEDTAFDPCGSTPEDIADRALRSTEPAVAFRLDSATGYYRCMGHCASTWRSQGESDAWLGGCMDGCGFFFD